MTTPPTPPQGLTEEDRICRDMDASELTREQIIGSLASTIIDLRATRAALEEAQRVIAETVAAMHASDNNPEMYTAMDAAIYGRTLWAPDEKHNAIRVYNALRALVALATHAAPRTVTVNDKRKQ